MTLLLFLITAYNPEKQANALFDYATKPDSKLYGSLDDFDGSGNLWMICNWNNDLYLSKISPSGDITIDSKLLFDPEHPRLVFESSQIVFDRWDNAYFAFSTKTYDSPSKDVHIMRLTPEGEAKDYYPWPELSAIGSPYIGMLPSDTLMILGPSLSGTTRDLLWHLSKVSLHDNDFTPVVEETKDYRNFPTRLSVKHRFAASLTNWSLGWGIFAVIYDGINKPDKGPENLHLIGLDLTFRSEDTYNAPREIYRWHDFIWKTYDAWIGSMFFAPYKDEGYVLYIPDPGNPDLTHSIRLNDKGVPIDPSGLKNEGSAATRPFDHLPSNAEKYSSFEWWHDYYLNLDSVRVVFWGSDDKGNLYNYSKVKKF